MMEQIISKLLEGNSETIGQATSEVREAFKRPETVPELCNLMAFSGLIQVRQYSAILLRKRFAKRRSWQKLSSEQQQSIKQGVLNALVQEPEKPVRNSIAQLLGTIIKHEADKNESWMDEVLKIIFNFCSSTDKKQQETGASVLSILTEVAPDQFIPRFEVMCEVFSSAFQAVENGNMEINIIHNYIIAMGNLVPFVIGHNVAENTYQKLIPYTVKVLEHYAINDKDNFIKAFEILEDLADYSPKLLTNNVKMLIDFCLEAANNAKLDCSVQVACVAYIGSIIRVKKKTVLKLKVIEPIIQTLFKLMASSPEDGTEDEEDYFEGDETTSPMTTATQTMDLLALHFPPDKLIPPLMNLLQSALSGDNKLYKKAAYLCVAVIAEGCSETICIKYLPQLLDIIKVGLNDNNTIVKNAAFFALGQFSEHLQPDISNFAPVILPILFEFLQELCINLKNGEPEPKHIDRMFYALETFCENLEENLVPHLPGLMERLFLALDMKYSVHLRELALSAIASAISAAKTSVLPYFDTIITNLKPYLVKTDDDDICALRPQAIETLASLARNVGKENFLPLANDTMSFALTLLESSDDPDLRTSIYNLLGALAEVVNDQMSTALPKIVEKMLESISFTEEIIYNVNETEQIDIQDDDDDKNDIDIEFSDEDDDDDLAGAGFEIENSYLREKEEAINVLQQLAEHTDEAFRPYFKSCFESVYKTIDHPTCDIKKASIEALCAFIIALNKLQDNHSVYDSILAIVPKFSEIIHNDDEYEVVISALDGYYDLLKELKEKAIPTQDIKELIFNCIQDVMMNKVTCQFEEQVDSSDEQEESENEESLIESAGNILSTLGEAIGPNEFVTYFEKICPYLLKKIEKSQNKDTMITSRSFAYGVISECLKPLNNNTARYFETLLPIYLAGLSDPHELVRQNAVYGLGELVLYSRENAYEKFPQILFELSNAVSKENHSGVLDNICGAIGRLILSNYNLVPLDQVLPVFMNHLPLKVDYDENYSVFKSLQSLYANRVDIVLNFMEKIITIGLQVIYKKEYKEQETYDIIIFFLKEAKEKFPEKLANVVSNNIEIANFVQNL